MQKADAFDVRLRAARKLVDAREVDGALALSYVLGTSEAVESVSATVAALGPQQVGAMRKQRGLELIDQGYSWAQAARAVGVAKQTVGDWVKQRVAA